MVKTSRCGNKDILDEDEDTPRWIWNERKDLTDYLPSSCSIDVDRSWNLALKETVWIVIQCEVTNYRQRALSSRGGRSKRWNKHAVQLYWFFSPLGLVLISILLIFDLEEVPSSQSDQMCALESHSVETTIKWFQFCVVVNLHFSSFNINDQLFSSHRALLLVFCRYALQGSRWKTKDLTYKITKYPKGEQS